jgi:hypothetical protein
MNKCELLGKGGSVRKRGAVLVPAIFTQGIRIPAFLTLSEPKKIGVGQPVQMGSAAIIDFPKTPPAILAPKLMLAIQYYGCCVVDSYHEDRTHLGLGKGAPDGRTRTIVSGRVLSHVRLGGLHHRYDQAA